MGQQTNKILGEGASGKLNLKKKLGGGGVVMGEQGKGTTGWANCYGASWWSRLRAPLCRHYGVPI